MPSLKLLEEMTSLAVIGLLGAAPLAEPSRRVLGVFPMARGVAFHLWGKGINGSNNRRKSQQHKCGKIQYVYSSGIMGLSPMRFRL